MFMFIWVRWMWPRFRYDQLMDLGWRRFIPLALANIVVTAVMLWLELMHELEMIVKRKQTEFLGTALSAGDHRRVQGHACRHFFRQEGDDAVSRGEMGRAARVIAARRIW